MRERSPLIHEQLDPSLNEFQKIALEKLKGHGLTASHFKGCDWFNSRTHIHVLGYLMLAKHMPVSASIRELENLQADQLIGLLKGSSKQEVIGLSKYQIKALRHFSVWGLMATHLRSKDWFNSKLHYNVLRKLILEDLFKPESALQTMIDLNEIQLTTLLQHNLTIDELRGLTKWELSVLCLLKNYGLTHAQIKNKAWLNRQDQINALETLVTSLNYSPESALEQIENLTEKQLKLIMMGYERHDILSLTSAQLNLFISHRNLTIVLQLKPSHIANKAWFNSIHHLQATVRMLEVFSGNLENVLTELNNFNEEQAKVIHPGISRKDIIDLNKFQLIAYRELKNQDLTLEHLRHNSWFNSNAHVQALVELMKSPPYLTPDDAMRMLENSDENMALNIAKRHEDFPYDERIEKFTALYYTKFLVEIIKQTADDTYESSLELLIAELDKLSKSLHSSTIPQDVRKETASAIVNEIESNPALSPLNKYNLLIAASTHSMFGHVNKLSQAANSFSTFFGKKQWDTNTQKILIRAAKDIKKTIAFRGDSLSHEEEEEDNSLNAMPSSV